MYREYLRKSLPWAIVASVLAYGEALAADDATARCAREVSSDERIRCLEEAYLELAARDPEPESSTATAQTGSASAGSKSAAGNDASGDTTAAAAIEQFGASRNNSKDPVLDSIKVSVISVSNNAYGKLMYTTDGGQEWLQTDTKNVRYRQIPFEAEIRHASAGSFFLRPKTGGVAIRVRRVH